MSDAVSDLHVHWLGRTDFASALALQEKIVAAKREDPSQLDELLLLEHEPVYTIGRTPDQSSLLGAAHLPHPLFAINRGGQATYHGPGQLMGYPIIDLLRCGQDLHKYLRWLEHLLIELLAEHRIEHSQRECGSADAKLGERLRVRLEAVHKRREGRFDESALVSVAPILGLTERALCELARDEWHPEEIDACDGLSQFKTDYHGMAVNAY